MPIIIATASQQPDLFSVTIWSTGHMKRLVSISHLVLARANILHRSATR